MEKRFLKNYSRYEIWEDGRIYSLIYNKFLSPAETHDGYLQVVLYDDFGSKKSFLVHKLIAQAFLENPNNYDCINHKDENKKNNNKNNLE